MTTFFRKWLGKPLDFDGNFGNQCVDVIKAYFSEVLGLSPIQGNAIDYWRDILGFTRIPKGWFNTPNPGDIIVWGTNYNPYGHIAVCNWVRSFDLNVFEQNNPIGSACHYGTHSYKGILGWLRPDKVNVGNPRPSQDRYTIKMVYLSDTDDIMVQAAHCAYKLEEFTGKRLTLEYEFKKITPVNSLYGRDLPQDTASNLVENQTYEPHHWVVLGYHGDSSSAGYSTQTSLTQGLWYTAGYKPFPKEVLLFELKHFLVRFYNQHRGTNPYIDSYDNYKSADGGLAQVEQQIKQLIPYLSVFKL